MNSVTQLSKTQQIDYVAEVKRSDTYFTLIQKVGSSGRYQLCMLYIFIFVFLATGAILVGSSFFFLNYQFQCKKAGLLTENCQQKVCNLDNGQRAQFINKIVPGKSLATQFGPFLCQNQQQLDLISSSPYIGPLIGFFTFSYFSDNFGRRSTMIISLFTTSLGSLLLVFSINIPMAIIGLIISGAGINSASNIVYYYLAQIVEDIKRQKYSITVQIFNTLGALEVIGLYYYLQNWRYVAAITHTIPVIILSIVFTYYGQQTPQFLLKQSDEYAIKSLNRIGKINLKKQNLITLGDIQNVKKYELSISKYNNAKVSIIDLFSLPSIRYITIFTCLLNCLIFLLYYGPIFIVDEIGFDVYVSSVAIQVSQLVCFIPGYYLIQKVSRKKIAYILFIVTFSAAFVLYFVQKPQKCQICSEGIVELILIFIFRFSISAQYMIFLVYIVELFPTRVSGLGVGAVSASGAFATTLGPIFIGFLQRNSINVMILFMIISLMSIFLTSFLQQTQGRKMKNEVEVVEQDSIKTSYLQIVKNENNQQNNSERKSKISCQNG